MHALRDAETCAFLESGCALLVATATQDGEPVATRGWSLRLLDDGRLRLVLGADDTVGIEHARTGDAVAVTATSVRDLHSLQMKGRITGIEAADEDDRARAAAYCDQFYADIEETDRAPRHLTERITPADFVAWVVEVDELFDQTPGPGAGRPVVPAGP